MLFHGGTLYIDDGKPTPALMAETLRKQVAAFNHRTDFKLVAPAGFKDFMWGALRGPASNINMIQKAENVAKKYGITSEQVDALASSLFAKAVAVQAAGFHAGDRAGRH